MKSTNNILGNSLMITLIGLFLSTCANPTSETPKNSLSENAENIDKFEVIAYYTGTPEKLENKVVDKLTQVIFSFLHLNGNKLQIDNAQDSTSISYLASLKETHPNLKVLISLGGWGGCETCSEVFSSEEGRTEFAQSVKDLLVSFNLDGIDLDWEYPTVEGFPGHRFVPEDKENFTALVQELRNTLGNNYVLTFAAGGFGEFLEEAVEWEKIMPLLDHVNIMSYDLVNGNSKLTGHHTPIYSTESQIESTDNAIQFLDSLGIPTEKIVIGAAFYARVWEGVKNTNQGLYQSGKFKQAVPYSELEGFFNQNPGFIHYWDSAAQAPYSYNPEKQFYATYDDSLSIALKTQYAIDKNLGGIMFWQLSGDKPQKSLLEVIDQVKSEYKGAQSSRME